MLAWPSEDSTPVASPSSARIRLAIATWYLTSPTSILMATPPSECLATPVVSPRLTTSTSILNLSMDRFLGLAKQVRIDLHEVRVAHHSERVQPLLHALDVLAHQAAQQDDAAVGVTEVLSGAVGDRALRLPGHVVLRQHRAEIEARGRVRAVGWLFVGSDVLHRRVARLVHEAAIRCGVERDVDVAGVRVVDRHADLHRVALPQDVRKDQRVLVRRAADVGAALHDADV